MFGWWQVGRAEVGGVVLAVLLMDSECAREVGVAVMSGERDGVART